MGPYGADKFLSNICGWFERNVEETFGNDDMEFEIGGIKGYAGTIAKYEDEFGSASIYGESKAHGDTKIRVLLAIDRYIDLHGMNVDRVSVVVGQPIKGHKEDEKNKIKDMLLGHHKIKVNGMTRTFVIDDIGIAPEGSSAFWCRPQEEPVRIIDIGSGTVNAATLSNYRHVNNASDTFNFGMETIKNKEDYKTVASGIIRNTTRLKWQKTDKIYICGGAAEGISPHIIEHYPNAQLLLPQLTSGNEVKILSPVFANAVGFYAIAKGAFG